MCPYCQTTDPTTSIPAHMREHDPSLTIATALGLFYGCTVGVPTEFA